MPGRGLARWVIARRMRCGVKGMDAALRAERMRAMEPQALGEAMEVPFMSWLF
jgi:hypothetical protein